MLRTFFSVLLTCLFTGGAYSQSYPDRTVKVVVPYGAGGAVDVLARMVTKELSLRLGQQFVIENQGGMGGSLGAANVAKATPDGYTLLFGSEAPIAINPHIYPSLTYQPLKDFEPITMLVRTAYYVVRVSEATGFVAEGTGGVFPQEAFILRLGGIRHDDEFGR